MRLDEERGTNENGAESKTRTLSLTALPVGAIPGPRSADQTYPDIRYRLPTVRPLFLLGRVYQHTPIWPSHDPLHLFGFKRQPQCQFLQLITNVSKKPCITAASYAGGLQSSRILWPQRSAAAGLPLPLPEPRPNRGQHGTHKCREWVYHHPCSKRLKDREQASSRTPIYQGLQKSGDTSYMLELVCVEEGKLPEVKNRPSVTPALPKPINPSITDPAAGKSSIAPPTIMMKLNTAQHKVISKQPFRIIGFQILTPGGHIVCVVNVCAASVWGERGKCGGCGKCGGLWKVWRAWFSQMILFTSRQPHGRRRV